MSHKKVKRLLIIGISGVTCGGKTTTSTKLNKLLQCKVFVQDDYYRDVTDSKHVWIEELNHINFDILSSLDMERMNEDILKFIADNNFVLMSKHNKKDIQNGFNTNTENGMLEMLTHTDTSVLIIEGFSIFNYKPWLHLFNLKYYFTLDKKECYQRRINRIYDPPDCPGYFEKCVWPEYLKQKQDIDTSVGDIKYFEGTKEVIVEILADICEYL